MDGSEVAIDDSGAPIKDRNGSITGVVLVFRDITERKQVEQELQESNQRFRLALKNAPVSVATQDKDLRFIWAYNQRTLMPEDVVGKTDNDVFIQGDAARLIALKHKVIETGTEVREQLWLTLNGKPIYLDLYLEPIRDAAEDITGIGIATVDLTPMKVVEDELHKAREDLELKVQERTADLQNAKEELGVTNEELRIELEQHSKLEADLIKAKETAEESVRAKSAFLANMSHELRTPMNAVIGFSSLLLDDSLTPEQKEFIEGIRKGGEALLAIIDDILEFSRVEKDKIELERQPFSLKHVIDESLDLVATQAGKKGLNLSKTIGYGTPDTIIGDHGRLRQILVNLLGNAVKFTDKGDVSVSVSSKVLKGDERQISFAVKDTGIGIPQDKMNEIFEPFVQVERTLSLKRDGVGLGLAITRNLVELMGGTIWAESIPGQGTTFSFRIPAETIPGKQLYFGRMDSGIASESLSGLKPMRILVAEDNPSNQRVLVEMLKRLGYRPDAVADGREVVQALERQDYDLVLMDIKMPEMDGITATQVIRKLRPENGPKIVAITAFALEGDREKCLEAGMDDYISKPVKMEELAEVLKEMRFDPVTKSRAPE
jgi:signal transduction histidine kinase/ActR/RegA family two-component response regulator